MRKIIVNTALSSSLLFAGGDIAPIVAEPVVTEVSSWGFELSPYFAMSSITGNSGVVTAAAPLDLPFDDILDALEFGVAAHFEAHHNSGWGLWIDYNYVSLGGTGDAGILTVDVKQSVFEGYGMYRQTLENSTIDYMAGIRRWNLKMNATLVGRPNLNNTNNDWVDYETGTMGTLDYFKYDTLTQGPIIGLNFKF
jgi:hypothetical protein